MDFVREDIVMEIHPTSLQLKRKQCVTKLHGLEENADPPTALSLHIDMGIPISLTY